MNFHSLPPSHCFVLLVAFQAVELREILVLTVKSEKYEISKAAQTFCLRKMFHFCAWMKSWEIFFLSKRVRLAWKAAKWISMKRRMGKRNPPSPRRAASAWDDEILINLFASTLSSLSGYLLRSALPDRESAKQIRGNISSNGNAGGKPCKLLLLLLYLKTLDQS